MTEEEWLASTEPFKMHESLKGKSSSRKLRLLAASTFRLLIEFLPDERQRHAIDFLELFADAAAITDHFRYHAAATRASLFSWVDPREERTNRESDLYSTGLMLFREFRSRNIAHHAVLALNSTCSYTMPNAAKKFDHLVHELGRLIRAEAEKGLAAANATPWVSAFIDVRWFADAEGWSAKTRVILPNNARHSLRINRVINDLILKFSTLRQDDSAVQWYGLKVIINYDGAITHELNTDPNCVVDPTWFHS